MTDHKHTTPAEEKDPVEKITGFWQQYSKQLLIAIAIIVVLVGVFFGYRYFVTEPNERQAAEMLFHGENFFRQDSLKLALEGDGLNPGFLKVISKYSGTKSANLAHFYAGRCYLGLGDFKNAATQLEAFSTSEPLISARAKALLADAYSEMGQKDQAVKLYKEAGTLFEKDDFNSPQYLFRAAYLSESMGKNQDAIELYKLIKDKYPKYKEYDIDKYLGRLGVTE